MRTATGRLPDRGEDECRGRGRSHIGSGNGRLGLRILCAAALAFSLDAVDTPAPAAGVTDQEPGMRIELSIDGGFAAIPGLAKPIVLDTVAATMTSDGELEKLVGAALAEKAQRPTLRAAPLPDARHYRITVIRDGNKQELSADDPTLPPAFAALMEYVQANGTR